MATGSTSQDATGSQDRDESLQQNQQASQRPARIYHERQSRQLCALHALNNLFQNRNAFTKQDLDLICKELAPTSRLINPHRSLFGLGCYDVNVIISALGKKDFDVIWFDKRKKLSNLRLEKIYGFILNVPNTPTYGFLNYIPMQAHIWSTEKHWVTIKKIGNYYYNLDSKLISPDCIGNDEALLQYLQSSSSIEQVEILIVVTKEDSEQQNWLKAESKFDQ